MWNWNMLKMQSSQYMVIGLFLTIENDRNSFRKLLRWLYSQFKSYSPLGYGGIDDGQCRPTIGDGRI